MIRQPLAQSLAFILRDWTIEAARISEVPLTASLIRKVYPFYDASVGDGLTPILQVVGQALVAVAG